MIDFQAAKAAVVEISKLTLGPNDVLVLRVPEAQLVERFGQSLEATRKYTRNRQLRRVLDRTLVLPPVELEVVEGRTS